jgi:hypothetical protein
MEAACAQAVQMLGREARIMIEVAAEEVAGSGARFGYYPRG